MAEKKTAEKKTVEKKTYVVTERAGRRVAGRVVGKGAELDLTTDEAAHHLAAGEIVEKGSALDKAFAESETAARLRNEAKAFRDRAAAPAPPQTSVDPVDAAATPTDASHDDGAGKRAPDAKRPGGKG
jgi:hypothetical protein